jgi:hypothetical protein
MRILSSLQDYVRASLLADDFFSGAASVPVLVESKSDFVSQIENAITKSLGIAVILTTPAVRGGERPDQIIASVVAQVFENPVLNQSARGTGKAAIDVAFRVYAVLRELAPEGWSQLYLPQGNFLELLTVEKNLVGYQVTFDTMTHLVAPEAFAPSQPQRESAAVQRINEQPTN